MSSKPSKGEQKIIDLLNANRVSFKTEVSFKNLNSFGGVPLRFDFAIYSGGRLISLLEVDGQQHFKFIKYFHKNKFNFMKAKEMDRKKNAYCLVNNIPLIRIPYWELEGLTFKKIFSEKKFLVKDKYHNDYLMDGGVK